MLIYILMALAVVVVAFGVVVALQPSSFRVARSAEIAAPVAGVFDRVNELRRWEAWSPWAKLDPGMRQTYEGPPAGTGAVSAWSGDNKVGEGRMTVTESRPHELIRLRLDFLRPFRATNTAEFTFGSLEDRTQVTWSMSGEKSFMSKAFFLFMNMDRMIGADFEKGLAQLKLDAEGAAKG